MWLPNVKKAKQILEDILKDHTQIYLDSHGKDSFNWCW